MEPRAIPVTLDSVPPASLLQRVLGLPLRGKLALGAASLVLAALLAAGLAAGSEPEWRVLYTSLGDKDGGAVIASLAQLNVPHKFSEGGAAILVPAQLVHDTRLRLASQGLPRGSIVGFELMENQKFGTTQFQERLNFQRGLEGELARSIMALAAVQSARVHLALPNQTAFLREQQKPSASVLLTLYQGRSLDRAQVAGIVHLIASSVPELQTRAVSVVDQTGALLSQSPNEAGPGLDATQLQYVRRTEQDLAQRVLAILEPIVGAGNVKAQVTADLDFSLTESTAETWGANQGASPAAVRSQHLSELPGAGAGNPGGSPGALSNQPPASPASPINGAPQAIGPVAGTPAPGPGGVKRDAVTNYEVDKTVKVMRNATGTVKRLSAAVVVNHVTAAGPDGKPAASRPVPQAQMAQLDALVREAIGFSKERGDSVQVVNASFSTTVAPVPPELPLWRQPEMQDLARSLARWLALPLVALIAVFGFVRPVLRTMRQAPPQRRLDATVHDAIPLGGPADAGAVPADAQTPLLPSAQAARLQERSSQLEGIRQLARSDPATVANVVRNWASQPG